MVLANECLLHGGKHIQRGNNYLIYDVVEMLIKVIRCKDNVLTSLVKLSCGKQNIYFHVVFSLISLNHQHRYVILNAWVNGASRT